MTSDIDIDETVRLVGNTNRNGYTRVLILTILIAVFGGSFQFGYQLGVINQPEIKIREFIETNINEMYNTNITKSTVVILFSLAVSSFCVGGMIGGLFGCKISDRFGRRKCLMIAGFISIVGEILQCCTLFFNSYYSLLTGRFITGIGCGIFTAVVPLYINEISPPSKRGFTGSLHQIMIVVGILVSQTLGLEFILGGASSWPILLSLSGVAAMLLLVILPFCPSSPFYLIFMRNDMQGATETLKQLRGVTDVEEEIMQIYEEKGLISTSKCTFKELISNKSSRNSLFVSLYLHMSQQLSGINTVIFYSTSIFLMAGLSNSYASLSTILLGVVQLIACIVFGPCIDKYGRRLIFLISLSGCTISLVLLTASLLYKNEWPIFSYVAVVIVALYVAFFGIGTGSVPWLMTPELFTPNYRDTGISVAIFFNWAANVTVGNLYPIMQDKIGVYSFLPFIFISSIFIILINKYCPETTRYNRRPFNKF